MGERVLRLVGRKRVVRCGREGEQDPRRRQQREAAGRSSSISRSGPLCSSDVAERLERVPHDVPERVRTRVAAIPGEAPRQELVRVAEPAQRREAPTTAHAAAPTASTAPSRRRPCQREEAAEHDVRQRDVLLEAQCDDRRHREQHRPSRSPARTLRTTSSGREGRRPPVEEVRGRNGRRREPEQRRERGEHRGRAGRAGEGVERGRGQRDGDRVQRRERLGIPAPSQ